MKNNLTDSELIINPDGSIYHCNIKPEDLATTILLVGDPERVPLVSSYFDSIEIKSQKREIITHTGYLNKKRLTVISTGMGTDNIDIVINELDALANIDLKKRQIKKEHTKLSFIRLGTSGALQKNIEVDSIIVSSKGLGLDGLMSYYNNNNSFYDNDFIDSFTKYSKWDNKKPKPYIVDASSDLLELMSKNSDTIKGITATAIGFYGPQGRKLRLELEKNDINEMLTNFDYKNEKITNFEMETSAIYGLSYLLKHDALSINTIVANRLTGGFSKDSKKSILKMIEYSLERITS